MTGSLKDVSSAEMIRAMNEMQCFAQEYILYGYIWQGRDGKKHYIVSEDALTIRRSFEKHLTAKYCLTPIMQWKTRSMVQEETKDDMLLYFKLQLARELQSAYPDAYFEAVNTLLAIPEDDRAEELLLEWKEELDGYFDEAQLELFDGALQFAYGTNHISGKLYRMLEQWIQHTRKQMMHRIQVTDTFERMFYGTALRLKTGGYKYLVNANEETLYQQMEAQKNSIEAYTPVYHRRYWYHNAYELTNVRKKFETDLKELLDPAYLERMTFLQQLVSPITPERFMETAKPVYESGSTKAAEGMDFWKKHWNISELTESL